MTKKDPFNELFFNSRVPYYNDDSDYSTNANSYYDDLARFRKMLQYLAEKVGHYDKELQDRFDEWDKLIAKFPENVENLLIQWLKDGTLEQIINENIFGELNQKIQILDNEFKAFLIKYGKDQDTIKKELYDKPDLKGYYTEHTIKMYRDKKSNTTYWLAKIPKYDTDGNIIRLQTSITPKKYRDNAITIRDFANREGTTLCINASTFSTTSNRLHGLYMVDGEVISEGVSDPFKYTLAFNDQNELKIYAPNVTASQVKAEGYTNALTGFMPLIENGKSVSEAVLNSAKENGSKIIDNPHPRTCIGQGKNGEIYFLVCTGRLAGEYGMTGRDLIRVMLSHGMVTGFMLDGGGSSTMVEHGSVVNRLSGAKSGDNGGTEREVGNALFIRKPVPPSPASKLLMKKIGDSAFTSHSFTSLLEGMRQTSSTWYDMNKYLVNGWTSLSSVGSNNCRFFINTDGVITMMGTIKGGNGQSVFMQLPPEIAPMFSQHFIAIGNSVGEIFKIIIGTDGNMTIYDWKNGGTGLIEYCKLDGIRFQINPKHMGTQPPKFTPFG